MPYKKIIVKKTVKRSFWTRLKTWDWRRTEEVEREVDIYVPPVLVIMDKMAQESALKKVGQKTPPQTPPKQPTIAPIEPDHPKLNLYDLWAAGASTPSTQKLVEIDTPIVSGKGGDFAGAGASGSWENACDSRNNGVSESYTSSNTYESSYCSSDSGSSYDSGNYSSSD